MLSFLCGRKLPDMVKYSEIRYCGLESDPDRKEKE